LDSSKNPTAPFVFLLASSGLIKCLNTSLSGWFERLCNVSRLATVAVSEAYKLGDDVSYVLLNHFACRQVSWRRLF
jgi:hypothetical protein